MAAFTRSDSFVPHQFSLIVTLVLLLGAVLHGLLQQQVPAPISTKEKILAFSVLGLKAALCTHPCLCVDCSIGVPVSILSRRSKRLEVF
jgi:hypothetical protein